VTEAEEASLLDAIARIEFSDFEMRGVVARRRVAFFGQTYDRGREHGKGGPPAEPGRQPPPIPDFLAPLRARLAAWAGVAPEAFAMALINQYRPGAPIGWHRDAPQYEIVAGVSLLSACTMKLRPYVPPGSVPAAGAARRTATHSVALAPRSAYLLTGPARRAYEHHIPPAASLRYSITLRTIRASSSTGGAMYRSGG
jgi:alkylated DNA repair dioxygenase AlkB